MKSGERSENRNDCLGCIVLGNWKGNIYYPDNYREMAKLLSPREFTEYLASCTEYELNPNKPRIRKGIIYHKRIIDVFYKTINEYGTEELFKQEGYVIKYKCFAKSLLLRENQNPSIDCIAIVRLKYTREVLFYLLPRDLKQLGITDADNADNEFRCAMNYEELSELLNSQYKTTLESRKDFISSDSYIYLKGGIP